MRNLDDFINGVKSDDNKIITAIIDDKEFLLTPTEAINLINQVSGVLLAYEYSKSE